MNCLQYTCHILSEFILSKGKYGIGKKLCMVCKTVDYNRFYRCLPVNAKSQGNNFNNDRKMGYDDIQRSIFTTLSCISDIYGDFDDSTNNYKSLGTKTEEENMEAHISELNNLRKITKCLENQPVDKKTLDHVDTECCILLKDLSSSGIINAIFYLHSMLKDKMMYLTFYEESLKVLKTYAAKNDLKKSDVINLLQIFSYKKKVETDIIPILLKTIQIDQLSLGELYIVLNSAFRAGVMLRQSEICHIESILETHGRDYEANQKLITALCKVIRHMKPTKRYNLDKLSTRIIGSTQTYNLATCAHILACYAEMHYAHPKILKRLMSDAIKCYTHANERYTQKLKFNTQDQQYFVKKYKYLDNILWAASTLNYKYHPLELSIICKFIHRELTNLINEPNRLVNIILCLWILNHKLEEELNICFEKKVFLPIMENDILWKPKARLNLLINCIKIESPKLKIPAECLTDVHVRMDVPPSVKRVYDIVKGFSMQMQLRDIELNCPIKGLYIAGVTFTHQSLGYFHINVLDDTKRLIPTGEPDGLMTLKIRLLRKLGYRPITIDENALHNFEQAVITIESCINEIVQIKNKTLHR